MDKVRAAIASNIRRYRRFNEMTTDELGEKVGRTGGTVNAWERGAGQPDADTLVELCHILHVDLIRMCQIDMEDDEDKDVLVMQYRRMDDRGRRALLACAAALADEFKA